MSSSSSSVLLPLNDNSFTMNNKFSDDLNGIFNLNFQLKLAEDINRANDK